MRILHISHGGLPDPRIEKTALTMKKEGHELVFIGGRPVVYQNLDAFERTYHVPTGNDLQVAFDPRIKRHWLDKIEEVKPDVIHAHNIIVAHFLLSTDYPVVYDDHEYWSKQAFKYGLRKLPRGLSSRPLMLLIPKWEAHVLRKYPVITTNENTAREHRRRSKWVGVTRNVPTLAQVEGLPEDNPRNGLVYVGSDFSLPTFFPHRDMTGLTRFLKFDIVAGLRHRDMMLALSKYSIGLTPWLPHPWHPYSDANRNYEYLHAGLQVVVNKLIKQSFADDVYVHAFDRYETLQETIDNIPETPPAEIMAHARREYIWENQENVIKTAYTYA